MKNIQKKPLFLIILLLYAAFTVFFEESFIFTHLCHAHDHNGVGESCSVCYEIERAQLLLEGLGRIAVALFVAILVAYAKKPVKKLALTAHAALTPVTLKVRLNT
ncbi:MAG: hypothetical protein LBH85_01375 [Treponema sp.]|nr:hypothetical protein [Treponema sp.]